jgi:hypothetical protein
MRALSKSRLARHLERFPALLASNGLANRSRAWLRRFFNDLAVRSVVWFGPISH